MTRSATLLWILLLTVSVSAFGQLLDPVGFCPTTTVPTTGNAVCSTATGLGGETIGIGTTGFYMFKNGSGGNAVNPWELLVAIPDFTGSAPSITSTAFTITPPTSAVGQFLPTTKGDLYAFAGTTGDNSMNAPNLFCDGASYPCTSSNEITAFGSLPTFFDVFVYSVTPAILDNTAYLFNVGGSGLPAGTFLAAAGGTNPFTTPFTTTGLVGGPLNSTPEPSSIVLLGTSLLGVVMLLKRKMRLS